METQPGKVICVTSYRHAICNSECRVKAERKREKVEAICVEKDVADKIGLTAKPASEYYVL